MEEGGAYAAQAVAFLQGGQKVNVSQEPELLGKTSPPSQLQNHLWLEKTAQSLFGEALLSNHEWL